MLVRMLLRCDLVQVIAPLFETHGDEFQAHLFSEQRQLEFFRKCAGLVWSRALPLPCITTSSTTSTNSTIVTRRFDKNGPHSYSCPSFTVCCDVIAYVAPACQTVTAGSVASPCDSSVEHRHIWLASTHLLSIGKVSWTRQRMLAWRQRSVQSFALLRVIAQSSTVK